MRAYAWRCASAVSLLFLLSGAAEADELDELVVTANRSPTEIARTGSAITVIGRDEIERASPGTLADVLRTVPGVNVVQSGGPGGTTEVNIRGAEAGHTLVLIDGVRVNDPANARNSFDFATFIPSDVERIEVLRGPQSALYGSDAMGGVINIITRKRTGKVSATASVEGGSYGTVAGHVGAGGDFGPVNLSISGSAFNTHGFSRVGDRDHGEPDGTTKLGGTARASVEADGRSLAIGATVLHLDADVDAGSTPAGDLPGYERKRDVISSYGTVGFEGLGGLLENQIMFFGTVTDSTYDEPKTKTFKSRTTDSRGTDVGVEYQGTLDLSRYGSLIFGARAEREAGEQDTIKTSLGDVTTTTTNFDQARTLMALFALHQFTLFDRLDLSLGARYDEDVDGQGFPTGRATAAYRIDETGTKLRGSFGNAAKRPTMFQLYDAVYGNPTLVDEESYGGDIGIDQSLWSERVTLSATAFYNRFDNLINFNTGTSTYENIASAETSGLELAAEAMLIPDILKGTASYTYLHAVNLDTELPLSRRPENSGSLGLVFTGIENFEFSVLTTFVGDRFNNDPKTASALVPLDGYAKVDLYASYRMTPETTLYGRVENLTDVDYEDAFGYNNAGLSAYVGLRWTH